MYRFLLPITTGFLSLQEQLDTCLAMLKNASPTEEDDEEETIRELEGMIPIIY